MRPLAEIPLEAAQAIKVVLCDIDDTLTWLGRIPSLSFVGMERLREAGIRVVPVTGRPAGWCDHIARMWPVDGVVGENGAFYFRYDESIRRMRRHFWRDARQRGRDQEKLAEIGRKILETIPGASVSADQRYREADLAIDFCEDVDRLPPEDVAKIVELFEAAGAIAKVSSIHVNGWFGDYDKLSMTKKFLSNEFGIDADRARDEIAFVGDSPNDEPMFRFFPFSVGVSNVTSFIEQMTHHPTWVTTRPGGEGFAEFSSRTLEARA